MIGLTHSMIGYFAIFCTALAGYAGTPAWIIGAGTLALASVSHAENIAIYERGRDFGLNRILNLAVLGSLLNALLAASIAYSAGWAFKWL